MGQQGPGWHHTPDTTQFVPPHSGFGNPSPPPGGFTAASGVIAGPVISEEITPEITSLARNLENDPKRIYDYVHNYIKYVHYFGSKKGATLTLLEGSGNDFDQCALLVALLRAASQNSGANWTVTYKFGLMKMPYSSPDNMDLKHWLGLTLNVPPVSSIPDASNLASPYWIYHDLLNYLNAGGGYPKYVDNGWLLVPQNQPNHFAFHRVWVKLVEGANTYYLDPAFKVSEHIPGVNVGGNVFAYSVYDAALTGSTSGHEQGAKWVKNLNWNGVADLLTTQTTAWLNAIKNLNLSVEQFIGGYRIQETDTAAFPGLLFEVVDSPVIHQDGITRYIPSLEWENIPQSFLSVIRFRSMIGFPGGGEMDASFHLPALKGRKLSLDVSTLSQFGYPHCRLYLDDVIAVSAPSAGWIATSIGHGYGDWDYVAHKIGTPDYRFDQTDNGIHYQMGAPIEPWNQDPGRYVVLYGFDDPGELLAKRQRKLDDMLRQGLDVDDPKLITESLYVMGLNWLQQTYLAEAVIARPQRVGFIHHHRAGRIAQEVGSQLGYYIDLALLFSFGHWLDGSPIVPNPVDDVHEVTSYYSSAFEHGVIEQFQINTAASTVKSIFLANNNGRKLIMGSPDNANGVSALLDQESATYRYSAGDKNSLMTAVQESGSQVLLPSGYVNVQSWRGYGFAKKITFPDGRQGQLMGISGGYNGGFSGAQQVFDAVVLYDKTFSSPDRFGLSTAMQTAITVADPVNIIDGSFTLDAVDLSVGQAEPRGFSFARHYDSNRRYTNEAHMANGWIHNYIMKAAGRSDAAASLGKKSALEMAAFFVAATTAYQLYSGTSLAAELGDPAPWAVTALIAEWAVDQLKDNAVSIMMGTDGIQFTKQPDGSYTPPAGVTMKLTKPSGYQLEQRHGNTFNFSASSGRITSIVDQYGKLMDFDYDGPRLIRVQDSWPSTRTLTFTYTGTPQRLAKISEGGGANLREVLFGYATTYSADGDLVSVTDPEGKVWTFEYDGEHKIIRTKEPHASGPRIITENTYDSDGKVIEQRSEGDPNKLWKVFVTDRVGVEKNPAGGRTMYFYDEKRRLVAKKDPNGNTSRTVYDGQDHAVQQITPKGEITTFQYNGDHNVTKIIDPLLKEATFTYDALLRRETETDFRGKTTTYAYNAKHQVTQITRPNVNNTLTNVVQFDYNTANGLLLSETDPENKTTSYLYDGYGQMTRRTYQNNTDFEVFVNNDCGDVTSHTDARNIETVFEYNKRRQLTKTTIKPQPAIPANNIVTEQIYDDAGNLWKTIDPRGKITIKTYSPTQKHLTTTLPTVAAGTPTIVNSYDSRDWLQSTANPLNQAAINTHDARGLVIAVTDPLQRTVQTTYDENGRQASVKTPLVQDQTTTYAYNARGEQIIMTDAAGHAVIHTFDDNGNPLTIKNRNDGIFGTTYYDDGAAATSYTPLLKTTTHTYHQRGLPATVTEPSGQQTTMTYDDRGRLATKTDPVGSSVYTYDKNNNLLTHVENGKSIIRVYDELNRLTSYTDENGSVIGYQYDKNGNLTRLTYPGGTKYVDYAYDDLNQLITVTDWANRVTSFTYDLAGRPKTITRPNNTVREITYNEAGETVKIRELDPNGLPLALFQLNYDEAGRIKGELILPPPQSYAEPDQSFLYDADNRITSYNGAAVVHDDVSTFMKK